MSSADRVIVFLATGFGIGRLGFAPGTLATPLGLPLAFGLHQTLGWTWYLPALATLWLIGVWLCGRAERALGQHDPGSITWDEFTTLPVVWFLAPSWSPTVLLVGFALHRLFDITKPPGVNHAQRLPGGWGVMADDIVASAFALGVMHLLYPLGLR
jgi:phosphatidylglycerophosphatase A